MAKSQIARLRQVLSGIAKSKHSDAEQLREEAADALEERWDHECEAEELRSGVERIVANDAALVRQLVEHDADESVVKANDLLDLLDRVDARDSLAFLERGRKSKPKPKARR